MPCKLSPNGGHTRPGGAKVGQMERDLHGTPVVPGVGWGPVVRPAPRPEPPVITDQAEDPRAETERLRNATAAVIERLSERAGRVSGAAADVLSTTAAIAADPELAKSAEEHIAQGHSAVQAIWSAANAFIESFQAAGGLLAERTTDLADIRDRVTAELLGLPEPGVPIPDTPSVLVADDLAPADTALLDPHLIAAIAIRLGGPTSHTAIIARQLGIACVVGVKGLERLREGQSVLVDGTSGALLIEPDRQLAEQRQREAAEQAQQAARWRGEGATADGVGVELLANVQDGDGARTAAEGVAAGIGLFRTELAFLNSPTEPSVERQAGVYREVLEAFAGRKVVVRTLDAGSDKPMPFLQYDGEENPALGVRGLRISARNPDLLDRQLAAIEEASRGAKPPWVMAPMVATGAEARFFAEKARAHGLIPGVMVEIPAAALRCEDILAEVDFVSIGTNDLSQYTMAADRLSPELASLCDPWHPAVLQLIKMVCDAGKAADKPVGVCGEAAADPLLAVVLVGLGVTSLSAAATAIPAVGAALARVEFAACTSAAAAVLAAPDADAARDAVRDLVHS